MVIRATKLKFVAESGTPVYFSQNVASTFNNILLRDKLVTHPVTHVAKGFNARACIATMLSGKLKENVACITGP